MFCLSEKHKELLIEVARKVILEGVRGADRLTIRVEDYPEKLKEPVATFVTLYKEGRLAGCIGSLEASQPLVESVAANAYSAAFCDHRFASIKEVDVPDLAIEIALLSSLEPLNVDSEDDLERQLNVGQDGLLLEDETGRATFLPKVWQALPDKQSFIRQLKVKAGWQESYWNNRIRCFRYRTETFSDV